MDSKSLMIISMVKIMMFLMMLNRLFMGIHGEIHFRIMFKNKLVSQILINLSEHLELKLKKGHQNLP